MLYDITEEQKKLMNPNKEMSVWDDEYDPLRPEIRASIIAETRRNNEANYAVWKKDHEVEDLYIVKEDDVSEEGSVEWEFTNHIMDDLDENMGGDETPATQPYDDNGDPDYEMGDNVEQLDFEKYEKNEVNKYFVSSETSEDDVQKEEDIFAEVLEEETIIKKEKKRGQKRKKDEVNDNDWGWGYDLAEDGQRMVDEDGKVVKKRLHDGIFYKNCKDGEYKAPKQIKAENQLENEQKIWKFNFQKDEVIDLSTASDQIPRGDVGIIGDKTFFKRQYNPKDKKPTPLIDLTLNKQIFPKMVTDTYLPFADYQSQEKRHWLAKKSYKKKKNKSF